MSPARHPGASRSDQSRIARRAKDPCCENRRCSPRRTVRSLSHRRVAAPVRLLLDETVRWTCKPPIVFVYLYYLLIGESGDDVPCTICVAGRYNLCGMVVYGDLYSVADFWSGYVRDWILWHDSLPQDRSVASFH